MVVANLRLKTLFVTVNTYCSPTCVSRLLVGHGDYAENKLTCNYDTIKNTNIYSLALSSECLAVTPYNNHNASCSKS